MTTEPTTQPRPLPGKPAWYRRKWVQIFAAFVVGSIVGGTSASSPTSTPAASPQPVAASGPTQAQFDAALNDAKVAQSRVASAEDSAAKAKQNAEAALAVQRKQVAVAAAAVAARERSVGGAEAAAKANSFDGADGKYIVGSDVKPGTYRATPSEGCYYARLSSLNDTDIIENNNTSGPVVVRILSSDKAFQVTRCGTFTRIGN
jgi:hypothetical protein